MRDPFSPLTYDLSGRTALVTGASSGLGARMAKVLSAHGAKVGLAARRVNRLEALADEIREHGGQAYAVELDVANEAQVIAAYDAVEDALGPVDTVLANAGLARDVGRSTENPPEDFDLTYDVNMKGVFLTAREGAKRMMAAGSKETGRGRVVLTSSILATKVYPNMAFYAASKAAVSHMGRTLALDWARMGVNVNMIAPGYILTEINEGMVGTPYGDRLVASFPRRRMASAGSLDAAVLWLCSDHSAEITGTVVTVDDGQSLG